MTDAVEVERGAQKRQRLHAHCTQWALEKPAEHQLEHSCVAKGGGVH